MIENAPMYVRIEDFEEVSRIVNEIKSKTERVKEKLQELKDVKAQEDKSINEWDERITQLVNKVIGVEQSLSSRRR